MYYTLDHLATFSCGRNQGLHHPLDAINKLRLLEKSSGIWTQRMKIKLDKKELHICSFEDSATIEKFSFNKVLEPTAVVTEDPSEIYNNILMFTVPQESKKKINPLSEIHLFQCISVSAQEIVDEINRLKSGAKIKKTPKSYYVPPQVMMTGSKSLTNLSELSSQTLNRQHLFDQHNFHIQNPNLSGCNILPSNYGLNTSINYDAMGKPAIYGHLGNSNIYRASNQLNNTSFSGPFNGLLSNYPKSKSSFIYPPPSSNFTHHKSHGDLRQYSPLSPNTPPSQNGSYLQNSQPYDFNSPQLKYQKPLRANGNLFPLKNQLIPQANPQPKESLYSITSHDPDGAESIISQQTEHDVMMLNHCFDDIENFISKLQHSHAALRELEKRMAIKKYNKHVTGNGMLSLRARPPSEQEFVDIFQKFKLAFNLLARLKNCIHDPNAPELVHFLFRPLEMIVHAIKQINYGSSELTHHIVTPLLTNRALELLKTCLSSRELEFWYSLGDAWHFPQDHFQGYARSFSPVFQDGWQARYTMSEIDKNSDRSDSIKISNRRFNAAKSPLPPIPNGNVTNHDNNTIYARDSIQQRQISEEANQFRNQQHQENYEKLNGHRSIPNGGGSCNNSNEINGQATQKSSYFIRQPPSTHLNNEHLNNETSQSYAFKNPNSFNDSRSNNRCFTNGSNLNTNGYGNPQLRNGLPTHGLPNGHLGNNDSEYLKPNQKSGDIENGHANSRDSAPKDKYSEIEKKKRFLDFLKETRSKAYEVMFDRDSKNPKELTVRKGEVLQILEDNRNWWKARNYCNDIGYVPYTILRPYSYLD